MHRTWHWLVVVIGLLTAVTGSGLLRARAGEASGPRTAAARAWTLDEVLAQLELYPRDAYFQYVALQLAQREGDAQWKRVVGLLTGRDNSRGRRPSVERARQVNLFSLTTGALAIQESLQLDAMTGGEASAVASAGRRGLQASFTGNAPTRQALRQLGLAFHNYHDTFRRFPLATRNAQGKALLSWRVQVLPFLDQAELYRQFHLDEPWDSLHNKTLIARMPDIYGIPGDPATAQHKTRFLVPVGPGALFADREGPAIREIRDGTSNTIMVVQAAADRAVIWTQPEELTIDPQQPQSGLAGVRAGWLHVLMADGSVRSIPSTVPPAMLQALYSRAGSEPINWEAVYARPPVGAGDREPQDLEISTLTGPTVQSHPFAEMLAGRQPVVSVLAAAVPEDFYYIRFRKLSKLLELTERSDLWAAHVFSQGAHQAQSHRFADRLQQQLCVTTTPLLRPFYDLVVSEVAIAGSDLFLREGSDVTLLFHFTNETVFRKQMDQFLTNAEAAPGGAVRSTGSYRNVPYVQVASPDRAVCVCSAYPMPGLHVRSNSRVALERIIDTLQQTPGATPPLGTTHEFQYMRTLFEKDAAAEDGFVYLSDPFIRNLTGPVKKITEYRRMLCFNHLRMLGHATQLYRTEHGTMPENIDALQTARCLPAEFGRSRLACPQGGTYTLTADGCEAVCSVHGTTQFLTPCCEIPATRITATENGLYQDFVQQYSAYWRTFFDPIGIRIQMTPQAYRLETIVLPLIDNGIYTGMARLLGGPPASLDRLPVAETDIFSMAVKFDKRMLVVPDGGQVRSRAAVNDLKQIALAFHNFHDVFKRFPPAQEKHAGLSWRVHLLPFLEQQQLYAQFRLDEPWDSPHNKPLLAQMPRVYGPEGTTTRILGFAGDTAPFGRPRGLGFRDILDGTSNTILVAEAGPDRAVPWTKPEDLKFDPENPLAAWGSVGEDGVIVAMMDGSVRTLPRDIDANTLKGLVTYRGGEVVAESADRSRRQPRALIEPRNVERALGQLGVPAADVEQLQIARFLVDGIGDEISFHMCDSEPTFSFSLPRFLGMALGQSGGRLDGEFMVPLMVISSLDAPVYLAIPVHDRQVVDRFLDRLDVAVAKMVRQPQGSGFFTIEQDYYQMSADEVRLRCFAVEGFGFRFRFFLARIQDGLYIASQPAPLLSIGRRADSPPALSPSAVADTTGHALIRLRPENWQRVLASYRLGWAEGNRQSCLQNLGPLAGVARARVASSAELLEFAGAQYGVSFFCPEGGHYELAEDGGVLEPVRCTVHGTVLAPRQAAAPTPGTQLDRVLAEFRGATATLTFTPEGLRAVLRIERQSEPQPRP